MPRSRISARVSGCTNAPPPVAITARPGLVDQPGDHPPLAVAEVGLAEALRRSPGWSSARRFSISSSASTKRQSSSAASRLPDGRLADAHHPDQHHRPVDPARRALRLARARDRGLVDVHCSAAYRWARPRASKRLCGEGRRVRTIAADARADGLADGRRWLLLVLAIVLAMPGSTAGASRCAMIAQPVPMPERAAMKARPRFCAGAALALSSAWRWRRTPRNRCCRPVSTSRRAGAAQPGSGARARTGPPTARADRTAGQRDIVAGGPAAAGPGRRVAGTAAARGNRCRDKPASARGARGDVARRARRAARAQAQVRHSARRAPLGGAGRR